ncbi:MAG: hypothetical protein J6K04_11945 [Lachnospiraceae bacterium]|nr:hypothetical protein [Lachnospiraceae bacterium]
MKRWFIVMLCILLVLFLIQPPDYWNTFQKDSRQYQTDTFYYIIKEEYREDKQGKRLYQNRFTDIQDGDILVTDSTYCLCFRHGHAALVVDAERGITLEAFGMGTESEYSGLQEWRRYPHVLVLRLKASQSVRDAVVAYAKEHLLGIPYMLSPGVIDDKDMGQDYWGTQCAHLVWAAFEAVGYDIDGDGGWLVTPADFTESGLLRIVPQE